MDPKITKHNKVLTDLFILRSILFMNGLLIFIANLYVLSLHLDKFYNDG